MHIYYYCFYKEKGILICGTGIGISIAANKCKGIRCALCHDHFTAKLTRMVYLFVCFLSSVAKISFKKISTTTPMFLLLVVEQRVLRLLLT